MSWLEENVDEGLTVFDFPRSWWRRIRTINGLERLHREIRRRTRVVGIFPHEASALRLISAVLAEIHEEWLTGRQYLNLAGWKTQVEQFFPTGPKENYRKTVCLTRFKHGGLAQLLRSRAKPNRRLFRLTQLDIRPTLFASPSFFSPKIVSSAQKWLCAARRSCFGAFASLVSFSG